MLNGTKPGNTLGGANVECPGSTIPKDRIPHFQKGSARLLAPIFENIPAELTAIDQWVGFHTAPKPNGKLDKIPDDPKEAERTSASVTDATTWGTFDQARHAYEYPWHEGIGFVLTDGDDIVSLDLDNCREPKTGVIETWAWRIIIRFASYVEISPSGTGIRIFVRGKLPPGRRRTSPKAPHQIEMYDSGRFMTVTGHRIEGLPQTLEERSEELAAWHAELFPPEPVREPIARPTAPLSLNDDDLLKRMFTAGNAAKIERLWNGDLSDHGNDHSAADLALTTHLAFYFGPDPDAIDRTFQRSKLYRAKWDRPDYKARTIDKAIASCTTFYRDNYRPTPPPKTTLPACPPEVRGTPDDLCQVEIAELRAENQALRRCVREFEDRDYFTRKTLTNNSLPAGERIALVIGAPIVADTPETSDGGREVTYAYIGKIAGIGGDTVGRAFRRLEAKTDARLRTEECKVQGRKYERHYLYVDTPTVQGLLSKAAAIHEPRTRKKPEPKAAPAEPIVEAPPNACPECREIHVIAHCVGCGVKRDDLGVFEAPVPVGAATPTHGAQNADGTNTPGITPHFADGDADLPPSVDVVAPPTDTEPRWVQQLREIGIDPGQLARDVDCPDDGQGGEA